MEIKRFIITMLQLLTWGTMRQLRGALNVLGWDMKPGVMKQVLDEMVDDHILCVWHISNHKYYGLSEEYVKKEGRSENEAKSCC